MRLSQFVISLAISLLAAGNSAFAAKDAGHGHDYRTFHTDGTIDYSRIDDHRGIGYLSFIQVGSSVG